MLQFEFADEWEGIALKRIHHSRLDIERLASKCLKTLENEKIEVGESVWYKAGVSTSVGLILIVFKL